MWDVSRPGKRRNPLALAARTLFSWVGDFVLPPLCPVCLVGTGSHQALCPECWCKIRFIEHPYCAILGIPFSYDQGEGAISPPAMAQAPDFDRLRSVALYDDVVRSLVHALKYRDRTELVPMMATWMRRAGMEEIRRADVILPVPLHRWRLFQRRFNQSAELARHIAKATETPYLTRALLRRKATRRQVGLGKKARQRNLQGAFVVPAEEAFRLKGKHVILVDDVFTTGATVNAAARALRRAGAREVTVLTFAMAFPEPI